MADTKNNYNPENWAAQTSLGRKIFALGFHFLGREIPGMKLYETGSPYRLGDLLITEYYWQADEGREEAIKVDVIEAPDWTSAQKFLLTDLESRMALNIPEASRKEGAAVGDVAYTSFNGPTHSLIFCRANLVIKLNNIGRKPIDLTKPAHAIDKFLSGEPRFPEKGIGPRITSFSLSSENTAEGRAVQIIIEGFDPLEKAVWYRLYAENGHFKRAGKQVEFSADTRGEQAISVHAFNEYGASEKDTRNLIVG